jgi:hypothetical protein
MSVLWQAGQQAGGLKTNPNLPGGDPYALPYGEAGQAVEDQRRRSLEAMAAGGTAGRQAVVDAQTQINAKRAEAVGMALKESQSRNAPQAAQDVIASRISEPYTHRSAGLDQGQAARAQDMAYRQAGNEQFFSQVAPAVQAGHDRMLGSYQRERARQDAERAYQQALLEQQAKELEQQVAQAKWEAEQDQLQREWERQQKILDREWEQGFAEKKFGWEKEMDERNFQQDLEMARLSASRSRGGGGGGSGGGSSGSSGFLGLGMGNKGETVPQLLAGIGSAASRLNTSRSPRSANAAEQMPHSAFAARMVDWNAGLPGGTTYNAVGGPKAFAVPARPAPPLSLAGGATYPQILNDIQASIKAQRDAGVDDADIYLELVKWNPDAVNSPAGIQAMRAMQLAGHY